MTPFFPAERVVNLGVVVLVPLARLGVLLRRAAWPGHGDVALDDDVPRVCGAVFLRLEPAAGVAFVLDVLAGPLVPPEELL
jgi:hypothetical protein